MGWRVPLADVRVTDSDIERVVDTYRSGWLSMGPRTEDLEQAFAAYAGTSHAVAAASGTAGLHLMTAALGLEPGDEVVVPSITFVATANAIAYTGATPVFADITSLYEPWLSADTVAAALTPRTRAIVTMSYGGHPGEILRLAQLAEEKELVLLEDAAHSVGGRVGERALGAIGRAGAFSFFSNKNLAVGEGGIVISNDDAMVQRMRLLRSHGMTTMSWDRHRGHAVDYDVVALGYNYRIDEARAALATARLTRVETENAARAAHVAAYRTALESVSNVKPTAAPRDGDVSAHHLFTVVLEPHLSRQQVREHMHDAGVQTSVHYPAVHRFSIYADSDANLPTTDAYAASALTLPLFPHMTAAQRELVVSALIDAIAAQG